MPNGTYGGVRGKETKVGQKTFVSRPTRLLQRGLRCMSQQVAHQHVASLLQLCDTHLPQVLPQLGETCVGSGDKVGIAEL